MNSTCLDKGGIYTTSISPLLKRSLLHQPWYVKIKTSLLTYQIASYMNFFFSLKFKKILIPNITKICFSLTKCKYNGQE